MAKDITIAFEKTIEFDLILSEPQNLTVLKKGRR